MCDAILGNYVVINTIVGIGAFYCNEAFKDKCKNVEMCNKVENMQKRNMKKDRTNLKIIAILD